MNQTVLSRVLKIKGMLLFQFREKIPFQSLILCLSSLGYLVAIANNGAEGIERYRTSGFANTWFDVVLMDLQMPVMDGLTCTELIRKFEIEVSHPFFLLLSPIFTHLPTLDLVLHHSFVINLFFFVSIDGQITGTDHRTLRQRARRIQTYCSCCWYERMYPLPSPPPSSLNTLPSPVSPSLSPSPPLFFLIRNRHNKTISQRGFVWPT